MQPKLSTGFVAVFYTLLTALAWWLGSSVLDIDVLVWHGQKVQSPAVDAALGAGLGLLVVALSQLLERKAEWARNLTAEFKRILGEVDPSRAAVFAVASGVGEELLFRGLLQQALALKAFDGPMAPAWALVVASLVFGLLHMAPDMRRMWPWTAMAVVLGGVFGAMFWYTGNVLAPIVAHATINFFNLLLIGQSRPKEDTP